MSEIPEGERLQERAGDKNWRIRVQGNFESHHKILKKLGYDSVGVKNSSDLECLAA